MILTVLLVDDDPDIREYTAEIMSEWNGLGGNIKFDFSFAVDGIDGIQKLHENKYDLLVLDMKMPKMSGSQAIDVLRANQGPNQHIPIIIVSGFPQSYLDGMKIGDWDDVFPVDKPIVTSKFNRAITFAVALKMKQAS